ncbi:MAG: hypothetical protein WBP93_11170 [Pyrinomonadaceae bacterium]
MKEQFNIFHQFAGCFVPHGLLSLKRLSAGAKICYSLLAQQANARGATQLNLPILTSSLGESEANVVRYLIELEETRLIESSRGNVNKEDVRILFPRHPWREGNAESSHPSSVPQAGVDKTSQPRLFAVEAALPHSSTERQTIEAKRPGQSSKQRRRRRWYGRPRSHHSLEACLAFITYQKEVLGRRSIYDPEGLAESIFHTGKQDDEIDDWLAEQSNVA